MRIMAKDHSSRNIGRESKNSKRITRFILFVEGRNTEPSYFKQLKKANCKIEPVYIKGLPINTESSTLLKELSVFMSKGRRMEPNLMNRLRQYTIFF